MKFKLPLLLLFIVFSGHVFSQNSTELPKSYFLDQSKMEDGKPLSIKMYMNYHLIEMIKSDSVNNLKGKEEGNFYNEAFKSKVVEVKPGNYFIENDKLYFKFNVDDNKLLTGEATLKNKDKNTETIFKFLSGIATNSSTKRSNKLYSRTELKDSLFISELWDKDEIRVNKRTINLKSGGGQSNTISTHYYKNGKVSSEQNNIDETFVVYYENGKIERQTDGKRKSGKEYDKSGKMESQYYRKDNQSCVEEYTDGLLFTKECKGQNEYKMYYYKKGKLDFYEVMDRTTGKTKVYDAKGKLMNKENTIPFGYFDILN